MRGRPTHSRMKERGIFYIGREFDSALISYNHIRAAAKRNLSSNGTAVKGQPIQLPATASRRYNSLPLICMLLYILGSTHAQSVT